MSDESTEAHWARLSFLDALRPRQGYKVTDVLLSTYSLDLTVLVSCLLAMTGRDGLDGGGSKVALAQALHHFRIDGPHRLAVMFQSGRITPPQGNARILSLLDRHLREVRLDQRKASWHAKAALVRFAPESTRAGNAIEWRLWIGSRNLTRDMSWDTGLVLLGSIGSGEAIPGVDYLADALLERSGWDKPRRTTLRNEFGRVGWTMPEGIRVSEVIWLDGLKAWLPPLRESAEEMIVVTPFLEIKALHLLAKGAGVKDKVLLTTQAELDQRLSRTERELEGWDVVCMESSEQGALTPSVACSESRDSSPEPLPAEDAASPMGLHAKIIATRTGSDVWLAMGSANITRRAWNRNTEVMACLEGGESLWRGVAALSRLAGHADVNPPKSDQSESTRDWLEAFRNALCNMKLSQVVNEGAVCISADKSPGQLLKPLELDQWQKLNVIFSITPLGGTDSDSVPWPPDVHQVSMRCRADSLAGECELVGFRLVSSSIDGADTCEEQQLGWTQHVPMTPKPTGERDKRILSSYLSPQQFIFWISGMLQGYDNDQESWSDTDDRKPGNVTAVSEIRARSMLTIESLLRAWQKDPSNLEQLAETFERYFDPKYRTAGCEDDLETIKRFRHQLDEVRGAFGRGAK